MSPHNAGCGAAGGGCDDFADEQAELPADRAASVQATTIVRNRLEGIYGENTTVVVQTFRSAARQAKRLALRHGRPECLHYITAGLKACTT